MKVLFVCNGNVARSQEAERFFNMLKRDEQSIAESGGINVKLRKPIDPLVIQVMSEIGCNISNAQRKFVNEKMVKNADLVVSFKPQDELPDYILIHKNVRYWNVVDPQHQPIEFHRQVRDCVRSKTKDLVDELAI